jgi:EmrB/QacA subfamily drug resistance transporter
MSASPATTTTGSGLARPDRPGLILTAVAVSQLMVVLDSSVVNIALPRIHTALGFSPTGLSWVLNAYTLTFGGLLLLGGRSGDILGRRRMFLIGTWIFTISSLLAGLSPTGWFLITARALQGVGGAIASPTALSLIATNFQGPARAKAIGVYGSVSGAGGVVGMILGGVLTEWASWRWTMFINVPIGIFVVVLTMRYIRESDRTSGGEFDMAGALLATLGVSALTYALIRSSSAGWGDPLTLVTAVAGVVLLVSFVVAERRAREPLMPLELFRNRNRASANLLLLLLGGTIFGAFFFVTQFLQNTLKLSPFQAGFAFVPWGVGIFFFSQSVKTLAERFGIKRVLIAGAISTAAAAIWLTQISVHSSYWVSVFGPMVLFGTGIGLQFALVTRVALSDVEPRFAGAAAGALNVSQRLGGSLGLAVLVTVYGTVIGTDHSAASIVHGYQAAFYVAVIYTVVALLLAVFGLTTARQPQPAAPAAEPSRQAG